MSIRERCQTFLVLGALLLAWPAWSQEPVVDFNIPPQGLAQALDALSLQRQVEILSDGTALENKQTPGLIGSYTVRQAVEKVLAGSGLTDPFTAANAVAIKKPEQVAANEVTEPSTGKEKPKESSESQEVKLPEMTVTASPFDETSYSVPNATTATKTDTPIFDTPVSVQVVQVLRDQQAIRLKDALKNVSGVQPGFGFTFRESFTVRGFDTGVRQYRDGFLANATTFSLANTERVEVLKGPASVLFGRIEPGGLINIVTKRPLASPYYALELGR